MNFFTTLSEKLGFKPKENDEEREEDELEDDEEQDDEDEEEDEERPSRFSLNNPFGKNKKQASSSDEEDEEEEPPVRRQTRHNNVIHDSRMDPRAAEELQYTHCERIVNVRQIEECREIIKYPTFSICNHSQFSAPRRPHLSIPEHISHRQ